MVEMKCKQCGNEFRPKKLNHFFCNKKCCWKFSYPIKKELWKIKKIIWEKENKNKRKEYNNRSNLISKDRLKNWSKKWILLNPEKYKDMKKKNQLKSVSEMSDPYIKKLIIRNLKISHDKIPQSLIKLKRILIQTKRYIKQLKQNQNT